MTLHDLIALFYSDDIYPYDWTIDKKVKGFDKEFIFQNTSVIQYIRSDVNAVLKKNSNSTHIDVECDKIIE